MQKLCDAPDDVHAKLDYRKYLTSKIASKSLLEAKKERRKEILSEYSSKLGPAEAVGQTVKISLNVNGELVEREVSVRMLLSDFIRHDLRLTGTHVGCEHGICGACTVIIDGKASRSCTLLAVQADQTDLRTIESVANDDGSLHPIQQAFHDCHALQCGYCTRNDYEYRKRL